jgi:hypothetical protein
MNFSDAYPMEGLGFEVLPASPPTSCIGCFFARPSIRDGTAPIDSSSFVDNNCRFRVLINMHIKVGSDLDIGCCSDDEGRKEVIYKWPGEGDGSCGVDAIKARLEEIVLMMNIHA